MGPKKSKAGQGARGQSASASAPQVDHAELKQAQNAYQQNSKKSGKKLISAIEDLRDKGTHMSRIVSLRLLLEKHEELKAFIDTEKVTKLDTFHQWLHSVLDGFKPEWERPLGDDRMSCTLVLALAACWRLHSTHCEVINEEDTTKVLSMCQRSFERGFSKQGWSKDWVDPRSEMVAAAEVTDAFVPECPTSAGMLGAQLLLLANAYARLLMPVMNSPWAAQFSPPRDILQTDWMKEAKVEAEAAKAATAGEGKQVDAKLLQQQAAREQQQQAQQQQARGRGRDTDRRDKDIKRGAGKEADDKLRDKELQTAREAEETIRADVDRALAHLESKLLGGKQLDKQQHLQALQETATVTSQEMKNLLKSRKDAAKDNTEAAALLEKCKSQFGDASPDLMLTSQLKALKDSSGYLYLDEALTVDSSSTKQQQQQKRTWETFEAFEEHVCSTYLTAPVEYRDQPAFDQGAPGLKEVYHMQMGDQLADADAEELMLGATGQVPNGTHHENVWVEAFEEDCPMARFLQAYNNTVAEDTITGVAEADASAALRVSHAMGFALLQLQRNMVPADLQQLSQKPPWVVLAYHTLQLCLPAAGVCSTRDQDFLIYNFWRTQMACIEEYQRVLSSDTDTYPDSTEGAVSDNVAMLQMLHEAQLLRGPLLLAVQLYLHKNAGVQLDLDTLTDGMKTDKALNRLSHKKQGQLRLYLFQVLSDMFASLPRYQQFLLELQEQAVSSEVPVQVVEGKQKGEFSLTVWPKYYEQACLSAAMPGEYHAPCCNKHTTMRRMEEASGQKFSRFDASADDYDSLVCDGVAIEQEDSKVAERYLVEPMRVVEAQQQQGIEVGTKEGLKALLEQLYLGPTRHPHLSKLGVQPAADPVTPPRSTWDKLRTDLLLAQQLAMHRQQLAQLIKEQSRQLENKRSRVDKRDAESMMRALFAQRVAGHQWVLYHLQHLLEQQQDQLRGEERKTQDQLRHLGDVAEKPGKGGKDNSKEKEKELNDKLTKIHAGIRDVDVHLSIVKTHLANNKSEAQNYPDLIRAYNSAATGKEDPLKLVLTVLTNELLRNAQNDEDGAVAQLKDSLKLSRLMLFDLDTEILHHVMTARRRVVVSAWAHKQLPVAVLLATEAIKAQLHTLAHQAAVDALLAEVEEEKKDKKPAQQQTGKKKKKKKGPAAKSAAVKVVEEDDEEEVDAEQPAAAVEGPNAEEQHQQGDSDDAGDGMVDILQWAKQQESSSSKADSKAAATGAGGRGVKGAAPAGEEGRESAAAVAAGRGNSSASATSERQGPAQKYVYYTSTPICGRCGDQGHRYGDCHTPYCSSCGTWGHHTGTCREACSVCGRSGKRHQRSAMGKECQLFQCGHCGLWGHKMKECPNVPCKRCGLLGHHSAKCAVSVFACRSCGLPKHVDHQCPPGTVKPATAAAAAPPPAGAAASDSRPSTTSSSRGRQQQQAAGPAAAAAKVQFAAGNVPLLNIGPQEIAQRTNKLVDRLLTHTQDEYVGSLLSSEEKQAMLARISDADLNEIFKQPDVAKALDDVYTHHMKCKLGSITGTIGPAELHPDAAAAFEVAMQQFPGLLHPGWRSSRSWAELESYYVSDKSGFVGDKRQVYHTAKEQAVFATVEAREAAKQQQKQQQREPRQQQRQPGSKEVERRTSTPAAGGRESSDGGQARLDAKAPAPAADAQHKAPDSTSARPQAPAAASVSFAAATTASSAAAEYPPAVLDPAQQQSQQQQSQQPHPLYAAPAADAWAAPQPAPGKPQMELDLRGDLQPWMCWFKRGAEHALQRLVGHEQIKAQLLAVVEATPEEGLAPTLDQTLMDLLMHLHSSGYTMGPAAKEGLMSFIQLIKLAVDMPRPTNPPMVPAQGPAAPAAAAPVAAPAPPSITLPPHLMYMNRSQQQQQPGGLLPYQQQVAGASMVQQPSAAYAQPTLQQQWPASQQDQLPYQQQQQLVLEAAADGGDESDNDEDLMKLVGVDSAAVSEQPAGRSPWATSAQQQHGLPSSDFPSLGASAPGSKVGPAVSSAGLANETGEYNCFLNVVVQCLYSCRSFREQVRDMPVYQQGNPVVHALLQLFQQMQAAEQGWKPGHDRAVVNPTELREALDSATPFRRQEMNDANELIDCMFDCFRIAQGASNVSGSRGVLIDSVFGIKVNERVHCTSPRCGVISHIIPTHWEHLLVVNSMALGYAALDALAELDLPEGTQIGLGRLLRTLFDQEQKACDKEKGGCGVIYAPERQCEQSPRVLTLQLVWSQDVTGTAIGEALAHIQEDMDISDIYAGGVANSDTTYHLSSAVAYYGQHYMALVRNEKLNQWLMFDDASVSVVGGWEDVKRKCVSGRIQPSVLFYQVTDLAALPDRVSAPVPPSAAAAAAAGPGLHHHPLQAAYAAPSVAGGGTGWGHAGASVPPQMHMMHQQQQQRPHPAAVPPGGAPHAAHFNPAVAGLPPPTAAVPAPHAQPWVATGPHSSGGSGNLGAAAAATGDGWHNHAAVGSGQDAWGPTAAAAAPESLAAAPAATPTGRPSPARGPAWGGAGRVAQHALGGIADQARGAGGASPAPGGHRGHGPRGRGGRG